MTDWLIENWLWIAIVVFFVWMHLGGHCGGHGHRHQEAEARARRSER